MRHPSSSTASGLAAASRGHRLGALGDVLLVLVPATILLHGTLGEWRLPLDAAAVAVVCALAWRRAWLRRVILLAYYLLLAVFILHSFNIELSGLAFYSDFAGSVPPPKPGLILAVAICLLSVFLVGRGARARGPRRGLAAGVLAIAIAGAGLAARTVAGETSQLRYALPIPTLTMGKSVVSTLLRPAPPKVAGGSRQAPAGPLAAALGVKPVPDSLYLNTIESWSDPADQLEQLRLEAQQRFGARVEQVQAGYRPWAGGTIHGELRELCGMEQGVKRLDAVPFDHCLPNEFDRLGYDTVAGHGYQGAFYLRSIVYPKLGFKRSYFYEDLKDRLPTCVGAFHGLCDADLYAFLVTQLHGPRRLLYFMSLQSHEPVPDSVLAHDNVTEATGVRANVVGHAFVRNALRILSGQGADPCSTLIYFVGDHEPPSTFATGRGESQGVSYLLIRLKPTAACTR